MHKGARKTEFVHFYCRFNCLFSPLRHQKLTWNSYKLDGKEKFPNNTQRYQRSAEKNAFEYKKPLNFKPNYDIQLKFIPIFPKPKYIEPVQSVPTKFQQSQYLIFEQISTLLKYLDKL